MSASVLSQLSGAVSESANSVVSAIRQASAQTGADFNYLLSTAQRESGLKSDAKSNTSSAAGLFQFVEQTWLGAVKQYGSQYGLGSYANAIQQNAQGQYTVSSAADKQAILALRTNPEVSALMAGEMAANTCQSLSDTFGRHISNGELYAAHFLGEGGARKLIQTKECSPDTAANEVFPAAAKANRSVFYNADGSAKTVSQVYAWAEHQGGGQSSGSARQASTGQSAKTAAHASTLSIQSGVARRAWPSATSATADATSSLAADLGCDSFDVISGNGSDKSVTNDGTVDAQASAAATDDTSPFSLFAQGSNTAQSFSGQIFSDAQNGSSASATLPRAPFVLTPGVVEILSSVGSVGGKRSAANSVEAAAAA
jgi:hypothetical protein